MKTIINNEEYFDVVFDNLDLPNSCYDNIEFEDCQFTNCDLSESTFKNCKFINCDFVGCNLSLVDFLGSKLYQLRFQDSKLIGIDWVKANWPVYHVDFELSFTRCTMNDSSFFGLIMHELKFDECKLHYVDFREGDYTGSSMIYSSFKDALFMRSNLQDTNFTDSTDYVIDVLENNVKQAKFSRYEALSLLESLGVELVD